LGTPGTSSGRLTKGTAAPDAVISEQGQARDTDATPATPAEVGVRVYTQYPVGRRAQALDVLGAGAEGGNLRRSSVGGFDHASSCCCARCAPYERLGNIGRTVPAGDRVGEG
jgi:hypothetical protein